jgi:hypothetical protein
MKQKKIAKLVGQIYQATVPLMKSLRDTALIYFMYPNATADEIEQMRDAGLTNPKYQYRPMRQADLSGIHMQPPMPTFGWQRMRSPAGYMVRPNTYLTLA